MADEYKHSNQTEMNTEGPAAAGPMDSTDRGLFGLGKKKEENKPHEEGIVTEFEKVQISDAEKEKHGLFHRSGSSSSSSSSDEEGDDEEKRKRRKERKEKKGLKEKLTEKLPGHKDEEEKKQEEKKHELLDTTVPIEKCDDEKKEKIHVQEGVYSEPSHPEDKKGFLDKIKEKIPGQKKTEDGASPTPVAATADPTPAHECDVPQAEAEKKGFLGKIKEKISGFSSPKGEEEKEKEKEKECAST